VKSVEEWKPTIEPDNGQQFKGAEIAHAITGGAAAIIYPVPAPGDYPIAQEYHSDCRGHMTTGC
jgi:hypothetical protein